ncbi:MAG: SAM-dependent methyltransferase [Methylohalobius sp. ZOD2]
MSTTSPQSTYTRKTMRDIISYYDDTRWDYQLLWFSKKTRAVHFGFYDETAQKHSDALVNMNRVLARTVDIGPGDRVLDAGCGQGGSSVWLAQNLGVEAVGITPVESQVRLARAYAEKQGMGDQVQFEIGDYTGTRFEDASFDVVWACESLCHADRKEEFYREAFRLLKPGGRLIVAEYIRSNDSYHAEGERLLTEWLHGWAINRIDSKQAHLDHAGQAGFTDVVIRDVTKNTEPSLRVLYRLSIFFTPLGHLLNFLGIRNAYQHGNLIGSLRQYEALQKGYWFYGIISARKPEV